MQAFWTINVFPFRQDVEKFADQQGEKIQEIHEEIQEI